jgi:hypothetical protein
LKRRKVGLTEIAFLRETLGFYIKENNSGNASFKGCPTEQSSRRRQEATSATKTEIIPLNLSSSFRIPFHQNEPLLM